MKLRTNQSSGLRYVGGKYNKTPWIVPLIPPHNIYCEVFGGAAHVLYAKEPSMNEVYNDLNSDMVNLFKVLQNSEKTDRLAELLHWTPHSREFFKQVRTGEYIPDTDPDTAAAYTLCVIISQSHAGTYQDRTPAWGHAIGGSGGGLSRTIAGFPDKIKQLAERMRLVQIEHLDFRDCIAKYDTPDTFFFLDPPYFGAEFYYTHKFTMQDHEELASIANALTGKAMVCYYEFDGMRELYPKDRWKLLKRRYKKSSSTKAGQNTQQAEECLLLNYEPPAVGDQLEFDFKT